MGSDGELEGGYGCGVSSSDGSGWEVMVAVEE